MNAIAPLDTGANVTPLFKWALIKALVSVSQRFVGKPLVKQAELSALGGKHRKVVQEAEEVLSIARQIVASVNPGEAMRSQLLGILDVRVAHHVLQKPDASRGTFFSLSHIGWQLTHELAELMGEEVPSPWQAPKRAAAPSSSDPQEGQRSGEEEASITEQEL